MPFLEKDLIIQTSQLPGAGKGLFTTVPIKKNDIIIEYTGRRCTWKQVEHLHDNGYIFFINEENVIDAGRRKTSLGRYANDAAGLTKIKGLTNNAYFEEDGIKVFIKAKKNIAAGSEIFVAYGNDYWRQVRDNIKADAAVKPSAKKKAG